MNITWWEYEELLDHLRSRPDLWTLDDTTGMWLRTNENSDPCVALAIRGPSNTGPYRQYNVGIIPMDWTVEESDAYVLRLVSMWTSYGIRMKTVELLTTDDGILMEPKTAMAVSVAIGAMENEPRFDPEKEKLFVQGKLPDFMSGFAPDPFEQGRALHFINGGGYLSFARRGDMLQVKISLKHPKSGGFGGCGQLTGYVRPQNGDMRGCFEYIFGVRAADPTGGQNANSDDVPTEELDGSREPDADHNRP